MSHNFENTVNAKLESMHASERISELIQVRLMECGWPEDVRLACQELAEQQAGNSSKNVDTLLAAIIPRARAMVPNAVREDLLDELEEILCKIDRLPSKK